MRFHPRAPFLPHQCLITNWGVIRTRLFLPRRLITNRRVIRMRPLPLLSHSLITSWRVILTRFLPLPPLHLRRLISTPNPGTTTATRSSNSNRRKRGGGGSSSRLFRRARLPSRVSTDSPWPRRSRHGRATTAAWFRGTRAGRIYTLKATTSARGTGYPEDGGAAAAMAPSVVPPGRWTW